MLLLSGNKKRRKRSLSTNLKTMYAHYVSNLERVLGKLIAKSMGTEVLCTSVDTAAKLLFGTVSVLLTSVNLATQL